MIAAYKTNYGTCFHGDVTSLDKAPIWTEIEGKADLLFTSPPFALTRQKKYGNLTGEDYIEWFASLSDLFSRLLKPRGSLVIEMGNAWVKGKPIMTTHPHGFDRIFTDEHVSWKCFLRSCIASLAAVFLVSLVWAVLRPDELKLIQ